MGISSSIYFSIFHVGSLGRAWKYQVPYTAKGPEELTDGTYVS